MQEVRPMEIIRRGDMQFNFVNVNGESSIRANSIGVVRANGDAPLWWIVSEEYSDIWTPEGGEELSGAAADQGALVESFRTTSSGRALTQITYGEVPEGFRQITPKHGTPPALEQGARYVLHFLGSEMAAIEFDF